jgi:hypothetical protein
MMPPFCIETFTVPQNNKARSEEDVGENPGEGTGGKRWPQKEKWFQVTQFAAKLTTGMHGIELCSQDSRASNLFTPRCSFYGTADQSSQARLPVLPGWCRLLETAFRSLRTTSGYPVAIPRSTFPACFFKAPQKIPQTRSVLCSPARSGFPGSGGFIAKTRCLIPFLLS